MASRISVAALALAISTGPLVADDLDVLSKGMALGKLIASEEYCGMTFDQSAIEQWIGENVPATAMDFPQLMEMGGASEEYERQDRTDSAKTAHCAAMRQTARHYRFIASDS